MMKKWFGVRSLCISVLSLGLVAALIGTALAAGGPREVVVDAASQIGTIRSLAGTHWDPGPDETIHTAIGVDAIRIHDICGRVDETIEGVGDIDGNGPEVIFPDWTADPNDPASYNFGPTDAIVQRLNNYGARILWNVGRSDYGGLANNYIPVDFDKYAEVVRHVVLHYNHGWADGFYFGIVYWEIWNEPDFLPFWNGTPEQYYELYKKVAIAIKSAEPNAKIGGPSGNNMNDTRGIEESFLTFVRDNALPLDFYSFHHYANQSVNPYDNTRIGQRYREMLDSFGFNDAEILITEWGPALDGTQLIGGEAARPAFEVASLVYMQDSEVDQSYTYMSIPDWRTGEPATKQNNAFGMVSSLNATSERLQVTGGDLQGFPVLAGRNEANMELRVVVANYEISAENMGPIPGGNRVEIAIPGMGTLGTFDYLDRLTYTYADTNGYNLEIQNIPAGWGNLTIEQYRIDNDNNMTRVSSQTISVGARSGDAVSVQGEWVHSEPDPPLDPDGVAQGVDLIVVKGDGKSAVIDDDDDDFSCFIQTVSEKGVFSGDIRYLLFCAGVFGIGLVFRRRKSAGRF